MSLPSHIGQGIVAQTRFPPSFDDNPLTYAWALFTLTFLTAVSLSFIAAWLLEARRNREVSRLVANPVPARSHGRFSPIAVYRMVVGGLLTTIVLQALGDVLVLFAWGEASDAMMLRLFEVDRILDGLTFAPFVAVSFILIRTGQVIDHRLGLVAAHVSLRPSWGLVRDKLKMAALVLLIATGVTLYKAAG